MAARPSPVCTLWLGLTAGALAWTACGAAPAGEATDSQAETAAHHDHEAAGEDGLVELTAEAVRRAGIDTAAAALRPVPFVLSTTGTVGFDERRIAHVTPRLTGRVQRVAAELGDAVGAGDPLVIVDSIELGRAKADFLAALGHHQVARLRHERQRNLFADRIVSEQEVLEAEAEAREAAAHLAAAEETLHLYGLAQDQVARLSHDDPKASLYAVRAPFAGKVVAKEVAVGELVEPERHLFTIADLSRIWVWIDVYERDLRQVRVGRAVVVAVDAFPGETFLGELSYLGDEVAAETRSVRARVDLLNPDGRLRPGMFARVDLATRSGEDEAVLTVPEAAVQREGDGSVVFVAQGENRFERRSVTLGRRGRGWVEILSGLEPGEEVVTEGAFLIKSAAAGDRLGGGHHH